MDNSFQNRKRLKLFMLETLVVVLLAIILVAIVKLQEAAGQAEQQQTTATTAVNDVVETTTYVSETEAIVSEESTTTTTTTTSTTTTTTTQETTTAATTTTQKITTTETVATATEPTTEETETTDVCFSRNVFLTEEDLNSSFNLSETYLTAYDGTYYWESSDMGGMKESYYPCSLSGVFNLFSEEIGYDYSSVVLRSDGVWCIALGESEEDWLVCVAADLDVFPRGSLVRTSLGYGIVCDTGEFTCYENGSRWFDIAVATNSWGGTSWVFNQE